LDIILSLNLPFLHQQINFASKKASFGSLLAETGSYQLLGFLMGQFSNFRMVRIKNIIKRIRSSAFFFYN
jgi:hypothetical protein